MKLVRGLRDGARWSWVLAFGLVAQLSVAGTTSGVITNVDVEFANINTDIPAAVLAETALGTLLTFRHDGNEYPAAYVDDFAAVDEGAWLVMANSGYLMIAISFGDACDALSCAIGDSIEIDVR